MKHNYQKAEKIVPFSPTNTFQSIYTSPLKKKYDTIEELEQDVVDMTREEYGEAIAQSHFSLEELIQMANNIGITTWGNISHLGIRKMRIIMELKEAYFPTKISKTIVSPWKKIPMNLLLKKAKELNITWNKCDDSGINRMRLIMALKKNNIQATDIEM